MQTSLSLKYVYSKQITGNVAWIVRVTRSQCRHDSRLTEQPIKQDSQCKQGNSLKEAFSNQITGNVNRIAKLHEVCVDKIVDNTEQPLKAIQSTQTGQF